MSREQAKPAVILLAAGASSRFGDGQKLLADIHGHTMLEHSINLYLQQALPVIVVHRSPLSLNKVAGNISWVNCPASEQGMGASIQCGLKAGADAPAWIIALADMPFIQPATIDAVVTQLQQGVDIVAPFYRGRRGHPVGFGPTMKKALLTMHPAFGARTLLDTCQNTMTRLDTDDEGILIDIDTVEQWQSYLTSHGIRPPHDK